MRSVWVVEDDYALNRMICAKLKQEDYHVFSINCNSKSYSQAKKVMQQMKAGQFVL